MIIGIGIDAIEIKRFEAWHSYSKEKLEKIYSTEEIEYCLKDAKKSAERFAVRFAAKEAVLKAANSLAPQKKFLEIARYIQIQKKDNGQPFILIDTLQFPELKNLKIYISVTHTNELAIAQIIIEKV